MVAIIPNQKPRVDTRGLPEGYDPHKFYEYRYQHAIEMATDAERFLYQLIPLSLVKSLALALDPTYQFKVSPTPITPENRVRYRAVQSVFQTRYADHTRDVLTVQPLVNYNNVGGCRSPFLVSLPASDPPFHQILGSQSPLPDYCSDTTSRTRLMGSTQGTLSLFKGFVNSPSRKLNVTDTRRVQDIPDPPPPNDACVLVGGTYNNKQLIDDVKLCSVSGQSATLSVGTHSNLRTHEIDYNLDLMQAQAVGLLKGWSPFQRDYNLFRNAVELRDLPSSILSLKETVRNFTKLYNSLSHSTDLRHIIFDVKKSAKDIPNEYLSYHFGWKATWKDLQDWLNLPAKLEKKYNFLIRRAGKPTTFRSKRSFVSGESGVSGFDYDQFNLEFQDPNKGDGISSRIERTSEVRLVINATFDFPTVEPVSFRGYNFYDRIGLIPRPTDIYNLVPWTWLVDWFSGLGNYVELIDNTLRDPSLINWGMISCVSTGRLVTEFQSRSQSNHQSYYNGSLVSNNDSVTVNRHTSTYEFTCETRRDLATFLDVSRTSVPTSLSSYQTSILGALLAQRTKFTSARFKVRT